MYLLKIVLLLGSILLPIFADNMQIITMPVDDFPNEIDIKPFTKIGRKLYYFGHNKVTWHKAFLICRSMHAELASIENQAEMEELSEHLKTLPLDHWWWLAASDEDVEGDFFWYNNGERMSYANWAPGQPDNAGGHENCVHLWHSRDTFEMNDWTCKEKAYYICEANRPKTLLISLF